MSAQPLVSCIMPTANRRQFVPRAIEYFLRQDYPEKELIILDDGEDCVADLIPNDPCIRYFRETNRKNVGAKRNWLCAEARGEIIAHWDDDDWHAPYRLSYQTDALLADGADLCGVQRMLFYDYGTKETWLYDYPNNHRRWVAGGSLMYRREFWRDTPFTDLKIGEDTQFVWHQNVKRLLTLPDYLFYVALIHPGNTSPKQRNGSWWSRWSGDIKTIVGSDLDFNQNQARPIICIDKERMMDAKIPTYSILMVVHNACEMVKMATLRTLRHSAGQDTRLVVVDNASDDGVEEWLKTLALRGDIDLIRNDSNIGHGPALEQARHHTHSPWLVTLDSDAFPLTDEWLPRLRERLNGSVKVAGILHHRDYIHPSCLMISRQTLDEFHLTFLNEKDQPSQLDVAERISVDLKNRGFLLGGLKRTGALQRGSMAEPVYLGSEYEDLVYHQWYTTRAATVTATTERVDDVSMNAIGQSLEHIQTRFQAESRPLTVIMGIRALESEPQRAYNAITCLQALNLQDLPRWTYRLVVIEQDSVPRLKRWLAPLTDRYIFAPNPGAYNRGWAFNIGAMLLKETTSHALCLIDADLLVSPDFLRRGLEALSETSKAVQPYREIVYLDEICSRRAIRERLESPMAVLNTTAYPGQVFTTSQGGCLFVDVDHYLSIGGHDERFRGWGYEDREFWIRLAQTSRIDQLPLRLLHLYHPRPDMLGKEAQANQRLGRQLLDQSALPADLVIGDIHRYAVEGQLPENKSEEKLANVYSHRDWENWHRWDRQRIEGIIVRERNLAKTSTSTRRQVARIIARLGDSLLDLGCGPGAIWTYLMPYRPRLQWMGADVTWNMISSAHSHFPDVPVIRSDARALPFSKGSFDVVMLRHVLEHLPGWLMAAVLQAASEVARNALVIDFNVPPANKGARQTRRVGENFIETQWLVSDILEQVESIGWRVTERMSLNDTANREADEVWIVRPPRDVQPTPMDERFKFSIIVPTYRRQHTLERTVHTILRQTYRNWELIIIDNEGADHYHFDDPRIQVYCHAEHTSASYARNQGLNYVNGDLVCFFDDDDEMFPNYLHRFAQVFMTNPKAKMARAGMIVSDGFVNFSFATPECCLRREFAAPTWSNKGPRQDQDYFGRIVAMQGWTEENSDIILIPEALCHAHADPSGGLRAGYY